MIHVLDTLCSIFEYNISILKIILLPKYTYIINKLGDMNTNIINDNINIMLNIHLSNLKVSFSFFPLQYFWINMGNEKFKTLRFLIRIILLLDVFNYQYIFLHSTA